MVLVTCILIVHVSANKKGPFRFAICVIGQARTLRFPELKHSLHHHLISTLPGNVDVFFSVDSVDDISDFIANLNSPEVTTFAVPAYQPVCEGHAFNTYHTVAFHNVATRLKHCFDTVLLNEQLRGYIYDFVIRTRPDLYFYTDVSAWLHLDQDAVFVGYFLPVSNCSKYYISNDNFAVVPRRFVSIYGNAIQMLTQCNYTTSDFTTNACHICDEAAPECFLSKHLLLHNISYFGCYSQFGVAPYRGLWTLTRSSGSRVWDRYHDSFLSDTAVGTLQTSNEAKCHYVRRT